MQLFRRTKGPRVHPLTLQAAEIEAQVYSLPDGDRQRAIACIVAIVRAIRGLGFLPDSLGKRLLKLLGEVALQVYMPPMKNPDVVVGHIEVGIPRLIAEVTAEDERGETSADG